jgi:hypothetical protein
MNTGLSAKMIIDKNQDIQLLISGSSALEIADSINGQFRAR